MNGTNEMSVENCDKRLVRPIKWKRVDYRNPVYEGYAEGNVEVAYIDGSSSRGYDASISFFGSVVKSRDGFKTSKEAAAWCNAEWAEMVNSWIEPNKRISKSDNT